MKLLTSLLVNVLAVLLSTWLLAGVQVENILIAMIVAIVLAIVNTFLKPVLVVLTLPITVLTLGLFLLVLNALMVLLVDWIVPGFDVAGFWWALLFSIILSIISYLLNSLFRE